jgi:hypothetical protein
VGIKISNGPFWELLVSGLILHLIEGIVHRGS